MDNNKKRILIKISGACLKSNSNNNIYDKNKLDDLMNQIKILSKKYQIAIVIGGGNIFRGALANDLNININDADYVGMLATVMNGVILSNILKNNNIKSKVFSSFYIQNLAEIYDIKNVENSLSNNDVCILTTGTGSSFFTTDTGVALRACQLNIDTILIGKNGVDGVYDDDPNKNKNAKRFDKLTYDEILQKKLYVMDLTSFTLCKENKKKLIIFNIDENESIINVLQNKTKCTIVE